MSERPTTPGPRPLPAAVRELCARLGAARRLVAHLELVHDAAVELTDGLPRLFPALAFDRQAVLFGAATHDLGKVLHPEELTGGGDRHEASGPGLLEGHGVRPDLARFARTHGAWSREALPLEDLLVALADAVWKGQRLEPLEDRVVAGIAAATGLERWSVYTSLDGLLEEIASRGDERLARQNAPGAAS